MCNVCRSSCCNGTAFCVLSVSICVHLWFPLLDLPHGTCENWKNNRLPESAPAWTLLAASLPRASPSPPSRGPAFMSERRVGLWFIGALGGVSSTAALGVAPLSRGLIDTTSLVTATPLFDGLDLDD